MKLTLLLIVFGFSSYCFADEIEKEIKIAIIDWCPAICPDKEKPGYIYEVVKKVFENSSYHITFVTMPWPRAIKEVSTGKYHALLAPIKSEAPQLIYPKHEVGIQKTCFYTRKDDPWNFDGIDSLKRKRSIAIVKGNSLLEYDNFVKANPQVFKYITFDKFLARTIKMIKNERINTFVYTKTETSFYFNNNKLKEQFKNSGCVQGSKLYLAFNPNFRESSREAIKFFDKRMAILKQGSFIRKLMKTYGLEDWRR